MQCKLRHGNVEASIFDNYEAGQYFRVESLV